VTALDKEVTVGKYNAKLFLDPKTLNPPQHGTISYQFTDTTSNKPVIKFQPTIGALLHNVIISRDLLHFWHSYTQNLTGDMASVNTYFPIFSKYYDYALFTPLGDSQQLLTTTIQTGSIEGDAPDLTPDASAIKTVGWLTFAFVPGAPEIKAGQPTQLVFNVRERGYPVTALWPYFDSPALMWVVDEQGGSFGHEVASSEAHNYAATPQPGEPTRTAIATSIRATPTPSPTLPPSPTFVPYIATALTTAVAFTPQPAPPVQQTAQSSVMTTPEVLPGVGYGPDLAFTHTFPHAGMYKVWVEVLYRSQVITVNYVISVVE
jgi:hypothetical protein